MNPKEEEAAAAATSRSSPSLILHHILRRAWVLLLTYIHLLAAPVHQMQQYYRHGVFDNCYEKWNTLFDCFNLKTKRSSEVQEILEARERSKAHIWTYRTAEEATTHWKELFGHVNDGE